MEEEGWQNRPTSPVASRDQPFEVWSDFVAANLLVDTALTTRLEAAMDSPYEPLRQRARKIVQEEDAQWMHVEGWAPRLAADPEDHASLVGGLQSMWESAFTWFGPVLGELTGAGLLSCAPTICGSSSAAASVRCWRPRAWRTSSMPARASRWQPGRAGWAHGRADRSQPAVGPVGSTTLAAAQAPMTGTFCADPKSLPASKCEPAHHRPVTSAGAEQWHHWLDQRLPAYAVCSGQPRHTGTINS
jgi:hypothetical protein